MPERFNAEAYNPETTELMKDAFEAALPKVKIIEHDTQLTRKLLASVILDQVNAGNRDCESIVASAVATLAVARNVQR
jgi:hypothetical protein